MLIIKRPLCHGPTPKRVPQRVPKLVRQPFLTFRDSYHHLTRCPVALGGRFITFRVSYLLLCVCLWRPFEPLLVGRHNLGVPYGYRP